jgi:hypothetical protein
LKYQRNFNIRSESKAISGVIEFVKDETGKVVKAVLEQAGRKNEAKKVK